MLYLLLQIDKNVRYLSPDHPPTSCTSTIPPSCCRLCGPWIPCQNSRLLLGMKRQAVPWHLNWFYYWPWLKRGTGSLFPSIFPSLLFPLHTFQTLALVNQAMNTFIRLECGKVHTFTDIFVFVLVTGKVHFILHWTNASPRRPPPPPSLWIRWPGFLVC